VQAAADAAHSKAGEYSEQAQDKTADLAKRGQVCAPSRCISSLPLNPAQVVICNWPDRNKHNATLQFSPMQPFPFHTQLYDQQACVARSQAGAKEAGQQAGDAARQGADFAADKTEEAAAAAQDYSKTGAKKVHI